MDSILPPPNLNINSDSPPPPPLGAVSASVPPPVVDDAPPAPTIIATKKGFSIPHINLSPKMKLFTAIVSLVILIGGGLAGYQLSKQKQLVGSKAFNPGCLTLQNASCFISRYKCPNENKPGGCTPPDGAEIFYADETVVAGFSSPKYKINVGESVCLSDPNFCGTYQIDQDCGGSSAGTTSDYVCNVTSSPTPTQPSTSSCGSPCTGTGQGTCSTGWSCIEDTNHAHVCYNSTCGGGTASTPTPTVPAGTTSGTISGQVYCIKPDNTHQPVPHATVNVVDDSNPNNILGTESSGTTGTPGSYSITFNYTAGRHFAVRSTGNTAVGSETICTSKHEQCPFANNLTAGGFDFSTGNCSTTAPQCQQLTILRGGQLITAAQIQLGDQITFRGCANTTVSSITFNVNGQATQPISTNNSACADYQVTIASGNYSVSIASIQ